MAPFGGPFKLYPDQHTRHFRIQWGRFAIQSSTEELRQIGIAWIMVAAAFAILRGGGLAAFSDLPKFFTLCIAAAITVGVGFLFHELAHKVVAQHYHCWAEFRADFSMLILAIAMSFFGFLFLAPGAVLIIGKVDKTQHGIISAAGPIANLILALLFLAGIALVGTAGFAGELIAVGFAVNAWLGLFNLIPFGIFDGAKIWRWNKAAYFSLLVALAALVFLSASFW